MVSALKQLFGEDEKKSGVVIAFFEYMIKSDYKKIIHILAKDESYGSEALGCNLPSLFDSDDEEGFFDDGIEFYEMDKEVKISFSLFIKCLELSYQMYARDNGKDDEIEKDLNTIRDRYKDEC